MFNTFKLRSHTKYKAKHQNRAVSVRPDIGSVQAQTIDRYYKLLAI